jgi:phosphoserine phosphatase
MNKQLLIHGTASAQQLKELEVLTSATGISEYSEHCWQLQNAQIDEKFLKAVEAYCQSAQLDFARLPAGLKLTDFGLLVMDMDSTLVTIETIDEMADYCGKKAEVAAITEAAMRGEISDYDTSLRRRLALLEGLDTQALERVYLERMNLSPGAERLVQAAHVAGLKTLLVSGGFTFFTEKLKQRLQLSYARSNTLGMVDHRLTGTVEGEIVNAEVKARIVQETCASLGLPTSAAIVMGDGANDLKMMKLAGLSVAYRAKPVVRAQASVAFNFCGLDGLLSILR